MSRVVLREYDGRIIDLHDPGDHESMMDLCAEAERLARVLGWPVETFGDVSVMTTASAPDPGRHSTDAPTQVIPTYPGVPRATGLIGTYARAAAMQAAAMQAAARQESGLVDAYIEDQRAKRVAYARLVSAGDELRSAVSDDRIQVPGEITEPDRPSRLNADDH